MVKRVGGSSELESAWRRVFASEDPFIWPFQAALASGQLFYPTYGCHLEEEQYFTLVAAMQHIGETHFLISITEGGFDPSLNLQDTNIGTGHWKCSSPTYEEYFSLPLVLENAIYSSRGTWGVLISHEDHAVIGGSEPFISALTDAHGSFTKDVSELRRNFRGTTEGDWVEPLVAYVEELNATGSKGVVPPEEVPGES